MNSVSEDQDKIKKKAMINQGGKGPDDSGNWKGKQKGKGKGDGKKGKNDQKGDGRKEDPKNKGS